MIIVITDRKVVTAPDFLNHLDTIAAAAPDMIILREKDLSEAEYRYLAIECQYICSYHNVRFCVNSFMKTALGIDNGRVQISFGSLLSNQDKLKNFEEIWVSVHDLNEAVEAERLGATHLICGNVFETACKPGAEGKGAAWLEEVCKAVKVPVFAVGGINLETAGTAIAAGCRGVCVRSLLMQAGNPLMTINALRKKIINAPPPGRV